MPSELWNQLESYIFRSQKILEEYNILDLSKEQQDLVLTG